MNGLAQEIALRRRQKVSAAQDGRIYDMDGSLLSRDLAGLRITLDLFYPGRLAAFLACENGMLKTTSLRQTLERQTGMYRTAVKIGDEEADAVVGRFWRSRDGCLRSEWLGRDRDSGALPGSLSPPSGGSAPDSPA